MLLSLKNIFITLSLYLIILCNYNFIQPLLLRSKSLGEEGKHSGQHFVLCFKRRKRLVRTAKDLLSCLVEIHSLILLWGWRSPLIVNALIIVMGIVVIMVTSMVLILLEFSLIVTVADL